MAYRITAEMVKIIEMMVTMVKALIRLRDSVGVRFTCEDCSVQESALG